MKKSFQFGENQTGIKTNLGMAKEMMEGTILFPPTPVDSSLTSKTFRQGYMMEAGVLGSVPELDGESGDVSALLIDKLGERLAFERGGVRLYSALIRRCEIEDPEMNLEELRRIREEEREHYEFVRECMERLGADSTAQTPCANAVGVTNAGLVQLMNDPRTDIPQAVQAILVAGLVDNSGWEMLIMLSEQADVDEQDLENFKKAKQQEEDHVLFIKKLLTDLLQDATAGMDQKLAV